MVSATSLTIETTTFPASVKPPGSNKTHFLAGGGIRGMEIKGNFVLFTSISVYMEDEAVASLSAKWKGKTAQEMIDSVEFSRDIVDGPFEKCTQVTMILPLNGLIYENKVSENCLENCVELWKSLGIYTDAEAKAIEEFIQVFNDKYCPPGSSILFTQSPQGSLTVSQTINLSSLCSFTS
ncbi:hypothetical protein ACFE04_030411 [Oxalis oulophora]